MARRLLPRLRDGSGDRSADRRPAPAGLGRHAGARAAVFVVPGICTDAEAAGPLHPATGDGRESRLLMHVPKVKVARVDSDGT
jgi:hypothetical protein